MGNMLEPDLFDNVGSEVVAAKEEEDSSDAVIIEEGEIFDTSQHQVSVYTPLDALLSEYAKKKSDIIRIAAYVAGETDVMRFFLDGARSENSVGNWTATTLFQAEPAIKSLDAYYWSKAMKLTDVLEYMNAEKRNAWHEQIRSNSTPPFEPETVKSTLMQLLANRSQFFAERVDGVFKNLSDEHLTNAPQGFGRRMILNYIIGSYGYLNHDRVNYIHDLRFVVAKFMGRGEPVGNCTYRQIDKIKDEGAFGEWHDFDGGAFRLRLYKKGTAHLEIHPMMAYRLNQILAMLHPMAIPSEFRKKPKKVPKEYELHTELVSFEVLDQLDRARERTGRTGTKITFYNGNISEATKRVLQYLGGVPADRWDWNFDYPISPVIDEMVRSGKLPEQKSHQFYPTPEMLADLAVAHACIGDDDSCLEPSAGMGAIASLLPPDRTTCVEISPLHAKVLEAKGYTTHCTDFLTWNPQRKFDRIIMNPPYSKGRDKAHLMHAVSMLNDDGMLVAILPASLRNTEVVEGWHHDWSEVYSDQFKDAGVSVSILTLTK